MLVEKVDLWREQILQQGVEQGVEQGVQQGVQQGMQQGVELGERKILILILQQKFGPLDQTQIAYLGQVNLAKIEQMVSLTLQATSIEEVFEIAMA